jgi:DNA-binding transcriptional ArsR family regulator
VTPAADDNLDDAVRALGHPGRRAMLRLARDKERTASELAAAAGLSPSAASPHLRQLRDSGLMQMRVDAKRRLYRADQAQLQQVRSILDDLWTETLGALKTRAESQPVPRRASKTESA